MKTLKKFILCIVLAISVFNFTSCKSVENVVEEENKLELLKTMALDQGEGYIKEIYLYGKGNAVFLEVKKSHNPLKSTSKDIVEILKNTMNKKQKDLEKIKGVSYKYEIKDGAIFEETRVECSIVDTFRASYLSDKFIDGDASKGVDIHKLTEYLKKLGYVEK